MITKDTTKGIAVGIQTYLVERRDKKHVEFLKSKPAKKKGAVSKGINIRLSVIAKRLSNDTEAVNTIEKAKKTKDQTPLAFQIQKYNALLALIGVDAIDNELGELKQEYMNFVRDLEAQHEPAAWLDEWSLKAKDISFATHVAKLTHSSSKGTSVLDASTCTDKQYLTTNTLIAAEIDTASSNAASLPIADILKVQFQGVSLLDCLQANDFSVFDLFTDDKYQIAHWVNGLKQAYDSDKKQSYFLSKQVFFPSDNGCYDLLLPLTSSSMAQAIHNEQRKYFEDEQTSARAQRKAAKYSTLPAITYLNKAKLNITGSNHSNASSLNGKRGGKVTLFSAAPSTWTSKASRLSGTDVEGLYKVLKFALRNEISELNTYLKLLRNKKLSANHPERAAAITRKVQAISHGFFDEVMLVNSGESTNWTSDSLYSLPYQLLFEPYRDDEDAKAEKLNNEWQSLISKHFGRWLNTQLDKKQLKLTTIHSELWAKLFSQELRQYVAVHEVLL